MKNQIYAGDTISLTAPTGGVVSGTGYKIGLFFVVAEDTVAQTLPFSAKIQGVFELPKLSAQAWTEGQRLYWDDTNKWVTSVNTSNMSIGVAAAVAVNPTATGLVLIGIPNVPLAT